MSCVTPTSSCPTAERSPRSSTSPPRSCLVIPLWPPYSSLPTPATRLSPRHQPTRLPPQMAAARSEVPTSPPPPPQPPTPPLEPADPTRPPRPGLSPRPTTPSPLRPPWPGGELRSALLLAAARRCCSGPGLSGDTTTRTQPP